MAYSHFAPPPPPPPPQNHYYSDQSGPFADQAAYTSNPPHDAYAYPSQPYPDHSNQSHSYPPPNGYGYDSTPGYGAPADGYFAPNESQTGLRGAGATPGGVDRGTAYPEKDDRDMSMGEEYRDAEGKGFGRSKQSRGSVAATLAAEGAIPRKAGLKMWRHDEHQGTYTRGGKGRCCGRCCLCTSCVIILLIVGVVCAFLLWVRPPSVKFNGVQPPANGQTVNAQPNGFILNFTLSIDVANPNFFGATFQKVTAKAFYPTNDSQPIGGGELDNVKIQKNGNTQIQFPFGINYTTTIDPSFTILRDIATKCGFIGSTKSKIKVDYDLTLQTKVLLITISPTFSSSAEFECPLERENIQGLLGNILGGSLGGLGGRSLLVGSVDETYDEMRRRAGARALWDDLKVEEERVARNRQKREGRPGKRFLKEGRGRIA